MQAIRIRIHEREVHLYIISAVAHGSKGAEEILQLGKIKGGKYQVLYDDPKTSYGLGELDVPDEPSACLPALSIPKLEAPILKH